MVAWYRCCPLIFPRAGEALACRSLAQLPWYAQKAGDALGTRSTSGFTPGPCVSPCCCGWGPSWPLSVHWMINNATGDFAHLDGESGDFSFVSDGAIVTWIGGIPGSGGHFGLTALLVCNTLSTPPCCWQFTGVAGTECTVSGTVCPPSPDIVCAPANTGGTTIVFRSLTGVGPLCGSGNFDLTITN